MSQQKVDRYKAEKANRKETMKKEKRMRVIRTTVTSLVIVAVLGWVGYSGFRSWEDSRPVETASVDYTAFSDYLSGLYTAE